VATIALCPHLDTVGVAGMTVSPFELTACGERLHGRGACDTKGPMAALLAALRRWRRSRDSRKSRVRWIVAMTAGEEEGGLGAQALVERGFTADFAVALEPTSLRVVHGAKGVLRLWLEAQGRAAHGSRPDRGVNAIYRMLPLATELRDRTAPALARRRHAVLGAASLNLGVMAGGRDLNIVPDLCRIGLDIRTHPDCGNDAALKLVEKACARSGADVRVDVHRRGESFVTDRKNRWAREVRRVARGWATADWYCDANVLAAHGIPSVAFGPGNIAQAHTKDEFITQRELDCGAAAFLRLLEVGGR
jgi:acetylornithine deacetylase/succinyl-diaminopimelate desuccinylase-like protein